MNSNIENEVDKLLNQMVQDINSGVDALERRQNEASVADIAGIVISTPFILQMLGAGLSAAQKFIQRNSKDKKTVGSYIETFADKMHHVLMKPLELLAATFTSDKHKQHEFAEIVLSGIILILLVGSGLSLVGYVKKFNIKKSLIYAFKSAVKSAELKPMISKIVDVAKAEITK